MIENEEEYNAVMTGDPQDGKSPFSMLEHVPSTQTHSSAAPILPFLKLCSQEWSPSYLQSPSEAFPEGQMTGCRQSTETGHLRL